jgi:hypothetical protein
VKMCSSRNLKMRFALKSFHFLVILANIGCFVTLTDQVFISKESRLSLFLGKVSEHEKLLQTRKSNIR